MVKQEYLIMPAEVEIYYLTDADKTDIILRKDIQQEEKQDYNINQDEPSTYQVYTCQEVQGRVDGEQDKEDIQSNFDAWWMFLEQQKEASNTIDKTSNKNVQMAVGTYVGTGSYGEQAPTALTFDFIPYFVSINNEQVYFTADNENKKTFYISSNESAEKQYNEKGKTYNYIALGY